jgi:acyl-CoA thioesterase
VKKDFVFPDAFADFCGVELLEAAEGYARTKLELKKQHLNGLAMPHGAAIFTLADIAFAAAANFTGVPSVAININISYVKAPSSQSVLYAEAREINDQGKIGGYTVTVTDESEHIVAIFDGLAYRKTPKQ